MSTSSGVSREVAIATKTNELQTLLEEWAKDSQILKPGERLVFSLGIEGVPTVAQVIASGVWNMPAGKFFDRRRLKEHGVHFSMASSIHNVILNDGAEMMPLREFIAEYSMSYLLRRPNLGPKSVSEMVRVLAEVGMTLRDDR